MSVLDPITHALAAVVATAHSAATDVGAAPDGIGAWLVALVSVVVTVRLLLLPLVVRGVKQAHAGARARPHLAEVQKKFREAQEKARSTGGAGARPDPAAMRELMEERRRISTEHGVSRLGCLPMLLQMPIWIGLYHLIGGAARGRAIGALDAGLVASLGAATLAGVPLADHGYLGAGTGHLAVVAVLAGAAALLSFVTQHFLVLPNMVLTDAPEAVVSAQRMMPLLSAGGMLVAAAVVPVALLVYWVVNAAWTCAQSAVVWRWFPTPGSPAALRHGARDASVPGVA